jgi:hypothetical protein
LRPSGETLTEHVRLLQFPETRFPDMIEYTWISPRDSACGRGHPEIRCSSRMRIDESDQQASNTRLSKSRVEKNAPLSKHCQSPTV